MQTCAARSLYYSQMATHFAGFPDTHWSVFQNAESSDEQRLAAIERLARLYWRPVYAYIRARWRRTSEDALDLAQEFFLRLLDGRLVSGADPGRGRFRAFLKASLDHFVINQARSDQALARGGGTRRFSLGSDLRADEVDVPTDEPPNEALDRHWRRAVLDQAIALLDSRYASSGRAHYIALFRRYDLATGPRPTREELAVEFKMTHIDVDTCVRRVRKDLVGAVREVLASTVDGDAALEDEVRDFFGGTI